MVRSLGILPLFTLKFKQSATPLSPSRLKIMTQACLPLSVCVSSFILYFYHSTAFLITDKITLQKPSFVILHSVFFISLVK